MVCCSDNMVKHKFRGLFMWLKLSTIIVAGLFTVACSSTGTDGVKTSPPVGDAALAGIMGVDGSASMDKSDHVVKVEGNNVTYMFGGSSSCPPLIDTVLWDERSKTLNTVMFDYPENTMCTMDYGQYFYQVNVDENVVVLDETDFTVKVCSRGECVTLER